MKKNCVAVLTSIVFLFVATLCFSQSDKQTQTLSPSATSTPAKTKQQQSPPELKKFSSFENQSARKKFEGDSVQLLPPAELKREDNYTGAKEKFENKNPK